MTTRRLRRAAVFFVAAAASVATTSAATSPPAPPLDPEGEAALQLTGDPAAGREAYEVCASCHFASGAGRPDGTFPQLAGQHATVLVKQLTDIRSGRRENPVMEPYAAKISDAREIADLAAFLQSLPQPPEHGMGPGDDLATGETLYRRDCVACHGAQGQGDAGRFVPRLAGQHYEYLLRQLRDIAARRRHNAHPQMIDVVRGYKDAELQAVADWASRLLGAPGEPKPAGAGAAN